MPKNRVFGRSVGGYETVYVNLNNTGWSLSHIIFTFFRWCGQIGDALFIVVSAWLSIPDGITPVVRRQETAFELT